MKHILMTAAVAVGTLSLATSCIQEVDPQTSYVTKDQAANAPGAFDNFVSAVTSSMVGQFTYGGSDYDAYDYGYPTFFIMWDSFGQDIVPTQTGSTNWYIRWYEHSNYLGPNYAYTQLPWTYYYKWIKNCNTVLGMIEGEPTDAQKAGVGIALAMRAMYYEDLARMYAAKTYAADKSCTTVPWVDENTTPEDLKNNPLLTNEEIWAKIIADLDKAEAYLADFDRNDDKALPDQSVVYGLKARAYLTMEDWANAEKYAKLAQQGYTVLSAAEYTDKTNGFNSPNHAWMLGVKYNQDDDNIKYNDGDSSWASWMCLEQGGFGYASSYGAQFAIDRHLYNTIPDTDARKDCFVDFSADEMDEDARSQFMTKYTDYYDNVAGGVSGSTEKTFGGLSFKFRLNGGAAGRTDNYTGFSVAVPLMRVEEMKLIEAEAVGMQGRLEEGIRLLTAFVQTRDPQYTYGAHGNDSYYNSATSAFQNEVWWQRRVEFWGEGKATFDIKRLQKGVIRSYAGTNHPEDFRWNFETTPVGMTLAYPRSENAYNQGFEEGNPTPSQPTVDSPEYSW